MTNFSYNSFVKFHGIFFLSHNMAVFYLNPRCNDVL